jgi:hypothetical protein
MACCWVRAIFLFFEREIRLEEFRRCDFAIEISN